MNSTLKVVGGVLLGAAIGAGIGLLVAPSSGKRNRDFITKKSKKYSRQALDAAAEYIDDLKKDYNKKVEAYAKNGKSSLETIKEAIKI
ncbi:MAG: hypothetical protein DI538_03225 [Azospira oryzae]|jgi:gas vesicle protein|nr:MAG: hypothetical protein DI538_03225 [Azospira oryzae]